MAEIRFDRSMDTFYIKGLPNKAERDLLVQLMKEYTTRGVVSELVKDYMTADEYEEYKQRVANNEPVGTQDLAAIELFTDILNLLHKELLTPAAANHLFSRIWQGEYSHYESYTDEEGCVCYVICDLEGEALAITRDLDENRKILAKEEEPRHLRLVKDENDE